MLSLNCVTCSHVVEDCYHDYAPTLQDSTDEFVEQPFLDQIKKRVSFQDDLADAPQDSTATATSRAPEGSPDSMMTQSSNSNGRQSQSRTDRVVSRHRRKLIQARVMVVEFLEQNGFKQIDVNCKKTNSLGLSRTYPLHEATKQNNPIMVYWLVYLGADPSQKDAAGLTAYQYVNPLTSDPQVIQIYQKLKSVREWQRIWPPPGFDPAMRPRLRI
ncbi:Putative fumarate reductase [Durusdinium trenchii]|uniref:Fumarate reductase n=1 Tax=Durusdinium trenchii TaxID=1381693 RepID=A0ABP0J7K7_9DINO